MPLLSYQEALKNATDLANRAINAEASLSKLSPATSPLPTLHKTFTGYVSASQAYSDILAARSAPESERDSIKKRWRLILERAEKVKAKIEALGGQVGKSLTSDDGQEDLIKRRGGTINGVETLFWTEPSTADFVLGNEARFVDEDQPELVDAQIQAEPVWKALDPKIWILRRGNTERWLTKQGVGSDCSVVAAIGACLNHNRRWNTRLCLDCVYPRDNGQYPSCPDNGKHQVKLYLNGSSRKVEIDSLLPFAGKDQGRPLFPTSYLDSIARSDQDSDVGLPVVPLLTKAYFKVYGGYSTRGSNPAFDIYTLTGWMPERIDLNDGFRREKEWKRILSAWEKGDILCTLGTAATPGSNLIPFHAYAVLEIRESEGYRVLEIHDPGTGRSETTEDDVENGMQHMHLANRSNGVFMMSWDDVCNKFGTVNLNWSPAALRVMQQKNWSWAKPMTGSHELGHIPATIPQYRLTVEVEDTSSNPEICVLLSQHAVSKDRPLDDIAVHVQEDRGVSNIHPTHIHHSPDSPFANSTHVLNRTHPRKSRSTYIVLPLRDRGIYRTDFTLSVFAPQGCKIDLQRDIQSLPYSRSIFGALTRQSAGGHPGLPSWIDNPQFRVDISPSDRGVKSGRLRCHVTGKGDVAWNVSLLWRNGDLVTEMSEESLVGSSGAYSHGTAYLDIHAVNAGSYTMVVSTFERGQLGEYRLSIESDLPVSIAPISQEGAGLFTRSVTGSWSAETAGGRPGRGGYERNPKVEITLPRSCDLKARLFLPSLSSTSIPLNITIYKRSTGGSIGEQVATSGPYSDATGGTRVGKTKLEAGVYIGVISTWEQGMGVGNRWELRLWSSAAFEAEGVK